MIIILSGFSQSQTAGANILRLQSYIFLLEAGNNRMNRQFHSLNFIDFEAFKLFDSNQLNDFQEISFSTLAESKKSSIFATLLEKSIIKIRIQNSGV